MSREDGDGKMARDYRDEELLKENQIRQGAVEQRLCSQARQSFWMSREDGDGKMAHDYRDEELLKENKIRQGAEAQQLCSQARQSFWMSWEDGDGKMARDYRDEELLKEYQICQGAEVPLGHYQAWSIAQVPVLFGLMKSIRRENCHLSHSTPYR